MANSDQQALVGRVVLLGAVVLGLLAAMCWTGVLPVDHNARKIVALALGLAAAADAVIGFLFLSRSRQP